MALSEKLTFPNAQGGELAGRLELPEGEPRAYAVFAHCFTCSKNSLAASRIARKLTSFGIAVLRFDFTGLGNSEGDFSNTNFSSNVEDLVCAANYLAAQARAPQILIGHSFGGAAVLAAATELDEVEAVITVGAPADVDHVSHMFHEKLEQIEEQGCATVQLSGRDFNISQQFIEDIRDTRLQERIGRLRKALLIFHSPQDEVVEIDQAEKIYQAAHHPKSFISLDGASHLLGSKQDTDYVAGMIAAWCERYVKFQTPQQEERDQAQEEGRVLVRSRTEKFTQDVFAGEHYLTGDEPHAAGGNDLGPSPYDFLLIALGTCTSMTLKMYADRKQIPLQQVEVSLQHSKAHAHDSQQGGSAGSKVDTIERTVKMEGSLSREQREDLLRVANKCPVHKTLHSEISIETRMEDEESSG